MAIPGELAGLEGATCVCGAQLPLQVCQSAAGYYLGHWCNECGPYSRETGYYRSYDEADRELQRLKLYGEEPYNVRF